MENAKKDNSAQNCLQHEVKAKIKNRSPRPLNQGEVGDVKTMNLTKTRKSHYCQYQSNLISLHALCIKLKCKKSYLADRAPRPVLLVDLVLYAVFRDDIKQLRINSCFLLSIMRWNSFRRSCFLWSARGATPTESIALVTLSLPRKSHMKVLL